MLNPMDMTGRTVLVTGASSGIGRETALLLSRLGARVIATGRDRARLTETMEALEGSGHRDVIIDLTDIEAIPNWIKGLAAECGPLHGLVHSAGIVYNRPLKITTRKEIDATFGINVDAAIMLAKGFRQRGCAAPGSSIVYLSSVAALHGIPALGIYSASKGALVSMTRTLAVELAREKLRVNCICGGLVKTPMADGLPSVVSPEQYDALMREIPLGLGSPLDIAHSIAFLLADTGRWITGAALVVDGGYTA